MDGRTGTPAGRWLAVQKAIRDVRPTVVVPTTLIDPLAVATATKQGPYDIRLVYVAHESSAEMLLDARAHACGIDLAVGVSRLLCQLLISVAHVPKDRVLHIPYGVAAPRTPRSPRPSDALRLAYVGRMDPRKRPLDLPVLCSALERRDVPYHLTVVGSGELEGPLAKQLEPRRERGQVEWLPALRPEDLYASVYPRLDCALLFSKDAEGLPIVPIEAMIHGVVPVVSDFRGRSWERLIRHGETGLVFPVGDLEAAADGLAALRARPEDLDRLSRQAAEAVEREHTLDVMLDAWARALDHVVERPPRIGGPKVAPPSGRLERLFGMRVAERLRRLARRRYPHLDPSEWPHAGRWSEGERGSVETEMLTVEAGGLEASGTAG